MLKLKTNNQQNKINIWLLINSILIVMMVIIGGTTRLTDSGLSMINWNLFKGIIPPLNNDAWLEVFSQYKLYPEFKINNPEMTLSEFKSIFFWEYLHRIWGRMIGVVFFIPFLFFWIKNYFSKNMKIFFSFLFMLGLFQAFMGWFMVKSGLVDKPDVSQYRLAAHLSIAFMIYILIVFFLWNNFRTRNLANFKMSCYPKRTLKYLITCFSLTFITIISGAFVAGTDAGLVYSNFPLMGDGFFPPDPFVLTPFWINFFENKNLIQFDHRILATVTSAIIIFTWFKNHKLIKTRLLGKFLTFSTIFIVLQYSLGIITLKLNVPISLGVIHQLGSLIILSLITICISEFYTNKKGAIR